MIKLTVNGQPRDVDVSGETPLLWGPGIRKYIGKVMQRFDTPSKVDGSAQFGIDMRFLGMLYASLAQPPELGGTVKSFNADKAKTMPGVREGIHTSGPAGVVTPNPNSK